MATYTDEMRRTMSGISFTDEDFIEKIIGAGEKIRTFSEAMDSFIRDHGYGGDINDAEAKAAFIRKTFREADMKPPREIRKWFEGQPVSRVTGFQICFAFGLNKDEVDDFFKRIFARERGFDCHNPEEAVYYWCFRNGLTFADAREVLSGTGEGAAGGKEGTEAVYTSSITADLDHIGSKEDLVSYLRENADQFAVNNLTAYHTIRTLWGNATGEDGLLRQERTRCLSIQDDMATGRKAEIPAGPGMSVHEAYIAVFQLDREQVSRLNSPKTIRPVLARMHSHIQDCFPSEQGIERILRGDHSVSYETIRKWLVLLAFYSFWAKRAVSRGDYGIRPGDRERCFASVNGYLTDAGYSKMYEGNPYDWLFFYAAGDEYPLETFRWIWTFLMDRTLEEQHRQIREEGPRGV